MTPNNFLVPLTFEATGLDLFERLVDPLFEPLGHRRTLVIMLCDEEFTGRIAVLRSVTGANIHARILPTERACSTPKVFTTTRSNFHHAKNGPHGVNPGKPHPPRDPVLPDNILEKMNSRLELAKLG
ncbi:MAG TPA: hypothetical protein VMY42_18535 [Thermoguttaceae bacterium]|nr:hypothetical protein [Thermoguttaceae bacterium]